MSRATASTEALEALWRQRAAHLSRRPAAVRQDDAALIVAVIGGARYGLALPDVVEVLAPTTLTPVPGAPPALAGVINVHGEIRPVIDLRRLAGPAPEPGRGLASVLLLRHAGSVMGLLVDAVEDLRLVAAQELEACRAKCQDLPPYVHGITRDQLRLLRSEALFEEIHKGVIA